MKRLLFRKMSSWRNIVSAMESSVIEDNTYQIFSQAVAIYFENPGV